MEANGASQGLTSLRRCETGTDRTRPPTIWNFSPRIWCVNQTGKGNEAPGLIGTEV